MTEMWNECICSLGNYVDIMFICEEILPALFEFISFLSSMC
jgi:hypothetical protein